MNNPYIPSNARIKAGILLTPLLVSSLFLILMIDSVGIAFIAFIVSLLLTYPPSLIVFIPLKNYLYTKPLSYFKSLFICLALALFGITFWTVVYYIAHMVSYGASVGILEPLLSSTLRFAILYLIGGALSSVIFYFTTGYNFKRTKK